MSPTMRLEEGSNDDDDRDEPPRPRMTKGGGKQRKTRLLGVLTTLTGLSSSCYYYYFYQSLNYGGARPNNNNKPIDTNLRSKATRAAMVVPTDFLAAAGASVVIKEYVSSSSSSQPDDIPTTNTTNTTTRSTAANLASLWNSERGQSGRWILGEGLAYISPLQEDVGYADRNFRQQQRVGNTTEKFLPATQWHWEDDHPTTISKFTTRHEYCQVLRTLDIRKILLVGDSITMEMTQSLIKLLGHRGEPGTQMKFPPLEIECPVIPTNITSTDGKQPDVPFSFEIIYARNDHLTNVTHDQMEAAGNENWRGPPCKGPGGGDICRPWVSDFVAGSENDTGIVGRTLLVVNTGLHSHKLEHFQYDVDHMLETLDSVSYDYSARQDILVFRTSVPGHLNCQNHTQPLTSPSQYEVTSKHDWDKVPSYNDYVKERLPEPWHILDVYPMTLLRPDHHRSAKDCLHYHLPGPQDWWNFLLYSNLLEYARGGAASSS